MNTELLLEADQTLRSCSKPPSFAEQPYIPIYYGMLVQADLPPTPPQTQTFTKEIEGDTTFCLRSASFAIDAGTQLYIQVQLPNGKFLFNGLMDVTQAGGFGSWRYLFAKELDCTPGTRVQLTLDTSILQPGTDQPESVLLEGFYKVYASGLLPSPCVERMAADMPRYSGDPNQNIMAPCWRAGVGPYVPDGWEEFEYCSDPVLLPTTGLNQTGQCIIRLARETDFRARLVLIDLISSDPGTVTGSVLMKIRAGCGYLLTDDYIDVPRYIASSPWAVDWRLSGGDNVYADLQLVDYAGSGTVSVQLRLKGYRGARR